MSMPFNFGNPYTTAAYSNSGNSRQNQIAYNSNTTNQNSHNSYNSSYSSSNTTGGAYNNAASFFNGGGNAFSNGFFQKPASFFGQGASQFGQIQGGIYNGGPTMNINFCKGYSVQTPPAPTYTQPSFPAPRYEMPKNCPPQHPFCPPVPPQPVPQPPVVPQPTICPPPPPAPPTPQPPVYTNSNLSYGIVAGDPVTKILDPKTGKEISGVAQQQTGFHNYVLEDGKDANIAGGSFAQYLNGQADANAFANGQINSNAQGFNVSGLAPRGLAVTSLVEQLNANEPNKVANTQYNLAFGNGANVRLAGGTTVVKDATGKEYRLIAGGDPSDDMYNSPDGLFKVVTGANLPGVGEGRTAVYYNEANGVQNVFHAGFRMPDGLGATERASAGTGDGSYIPTSNGNKTYYDVQYTKAAGQILA
jgi:hypothetical protein